MKNSSMDLDKFFEMSEEIAARILADFDVKIPFLTWSAMTPEELKGIYNKLARKHGKPLYSAV